MRILFNTMGLGKGGAERVISLLANSLVKENEVAIIMNINSEIEYDFDNRIQIIPLVKNDSPFLRKLRRISIFIIEKMKKIICEFEPDIIISFLPEPSFRVLFLKKYSKKIKNIPIIVSVRNDPVIEYKNPLFYHLMKLLYPSSDELVLQTNDSKDYFIKNINKIGFVIPNPVSDMFLTNRYTGKRKKEIVAVGRLETQKNYKNMIKAFKIVNTKHPDYVLKIYGDGILKDEIQNYINSLNLNKKVLLMGKTDDVKNAIYCATAFVMSSDFEGMPNSLLEAACLGVPCISTNCPCGGPKEILKDGKNGVLVPVNDCNSLADGICKIIEDKEFADRISKNSNASSFNYKKEKILKMWIKTITKTINNK